MAAGLVGPVDGSLAANIMETLLFGVYLVLFWKSVGIIFNWRRNPNSSMPRTMNTVIICVSFAIFGLIVTQWVLNASTIFDALVVWGGLMPNGALQYFNLPSHPKVAGQIVLTVVECIVADLFVAYRVYIIWAKAKWVLIVPIVLSLVMIAADIALCLDFAGLATGILSNTSVPPYVILIASIVSTSYSTAMIVYRMWEEDRVQKQSGLLLHEEVPTSAKALRIVIESAALYSLVSILAIGTYAAQSQLASIFVCLVSPVIGICFSMIIVRVGRRRYRKPRTNQAMTRLPIDGVLVSF